MGKQENIQILDAPSFVVRTATERAAGMLGWSSEKKSDTKIRCTKPMTLTTYPVNIEVEIFEDPDGKAEAHYRGSCFGVGPFIAAQIRTAMTELYDASLIQIPIVAGEFGRAARALVDVWHQAVGEGIVCPACGKMLDPGTRFCPDDGTQIMKRCQECGSESRPGAKFCARCGTQF